MLLSRLLLCLAISMSFSAAARAEDRPPRDGNPGGERNSPGDVSPARGINPPPDRRPPASGASREQAASVYRSIDGTGNNQNSPPQGAAVTPLVRLLEPDYADDFSEMAGTNRPSARLVSNIVAAQTESVTNPANATDFLWQWGQFLDHDIDLTDGVDPAEQEPIQIPVDDLHFYAGATMSFNRSVYDPESGITTPRQQLNEITAWIDASNVYGSDEERLAALRVPDSALLLTSEGDFLPFNTAGLSNAGGDGDTLFLAGDVRANEQVGLLAMHTLFVREHNRQATRLAEEHPDWSTDTLFEEARRRVAALMQVITYREFLPALLGPDAISEYRGYQPDVNGGIRNVFSTAAYRFGHSALSPQILRLDAEGEEYVGGHLPLRDAFFSPSVLTETGSMDAILRGLASQACSAIDSYVIDDVRNFLFGAPPSAGFDLAALNIQRGRDHGLPSYNEARRQLGLAAVSGFDEITADTVIVDRLATAYSSVEDIDLWVGGLAEQSVPGGHLGETFSLILMLQFEALRDGDRFWYQREFSGRELERLERTRLSDVIRRNSDVGRELQANVFQMPEAAEDRLQAGPETGPERRRPPR